MMAELESMAQICYAAGFTPHTPEISQCAIQLYSQKQASDQQRRAAATALGFALLASQPQPAPPPSQTNIFVTPAPVYPKTVLPRL